MDRISWDDYFITIAHAVATRSEDPSSKVGCVIVSRDNAPISFGYNGFIAGCNKHGQTFERPMKYQLVIHAEMNAMIFAKDDLHGAKLYCTHAPCANCLKHALQAGIRHIIFEESELLSRLSDLQLEAAYQLAKSVDMDCFHDLNGIWYGNTITTELQKRKESGV